MKFSNWKFIFIAGLIVISFISSASAYYFPSARAVMDSTVQAFVDLFEPLLSSILGGEDWGSYLLFEKTLLFVLLLSIVYLALNKAPLFEDHKGIKWIVAVIIPLIGIRFIDHEWLLAVIIQYQVLAIAMTAIVPFIVYFFFLYGVSGEHSSIRKIGWIFFIVVYFGLWSTVESSGLSTIYFWTMFAALIFLLADGTIHRALIRQQMRSSGATTKWTHVANLRRDINDIEEDIRHNRIPQSIGRNMLKKKQSQINWVLKHH